MIQLKRLVLDVLKPHQPDILELARAIAGSGSDLHVVIGVDEMDEHTESVVVTIEGDDIDPQRVRHAIEELGGSLHSIDEVEVIGAGSSD